MCINGKFHQLIINLEANILLILPLHILKNLCKNFSAIYWQKFNLLFQPSIATKPPAAMFWFSTTLSTQANPTPAGFATPI